MSHIIPVPTRRRQDAKEQSEFWLSECLHAEKQSLSDLWNRFARSLLFDLRSVRHRLQPIIGVIFRDFLDSVFSFDAKVFRTISFLLTRPGDLTLRFLQGKHVPYLNPVRLYFSVSVLLFLTVRLLHFEQADTLEFGSRSKPPHSGLQLEIDPATPQATPKFAVNSDLDASKNAWIKRRV
jgi:Protein of unknown function (DUF3667)